MSGNNTADVVVNQLNDVVEELRLIRKLLADGEYSTGAESNHSEDDSPDVEEESFIGPDGVVSRKSTAGDISRSRAVDTLNAVSKTPSEWVPNPVISQVVNPVIDPSSFTDAANLAEAGLLERKRIKTKVRGGNPYQYRLTEKGSEYLDEWGGED